MRRSTCRTAITRIVRALGLVVALGACQGPRYAETEPERAERERKDREMEEGAGIWSFLECLFR